MEEARLQITSGMRRILDYPKFTGPTRMLILETEYFFDRSWRRAGESLGWEVAGVPSVMTGGLTRDQVKDLFTAIGKFKPHFIITSNYAGMDAEGLFARFFEDAGIPYVSWFTDTPRMILYNRTVYCSHYSVAATWERAYEPQFRELGFEHVLFMPHAVDPGLFSGPPAETFDRHLAFVGASMIDHAAEAWDKLKDLPVVTAALEDAFARGAVTRDVAVRGAQEILDSDVLAQCDTSDRRNLELCMLYEATKRLRTDLARRLDPLGLEVRGDEHWSGIVSRCGGAVGYFDDLAPFYRGTAVNANTTSLQMKTAVNQRVFDCPAAGGFLITDAQEDLDEFYEPDEIVTYTGLDELEDKVRFFLTNPQERLGYIERAQKRIAARHTHRHRLQALEAFLKERYTA